MASAAIGTLAVKISALTAEFNRELERSGKNVASFGSMAGAAAKVAAAGFASVTAVVTGSLVALEDQRKAEARLAAAIHATGAAIDVNVIQDYAGELQRLTTFSDDAAINASAFFTSIGMGQTQIKQALPAVADLAAAMGIDLESAAKAFGKAVQGNIGALAKMGVGLDDHQKKAFEAATANERLAMAVGLVEHRFGGTARAMNETAGGAMAQVSKAAGEIAESFGVMVEGPVVAGAKKISDVLYAIAEAMSHLSPKTKSMIGIVTVFSGVLLGLATAMGMVAAGISMVNFSQMGSNLKALIPVLSAVSTGMMAIVAAIAIIPTMIGAVKVTYEAFKDPAATRKKLGVEQGEGFGSAMPKIGKAFVTEGFGPIIDGISDTFSGLMGKMGLSFDDKLKPGLDAASADLREFGGVVRGAAKGASGIDFSALPIEGIDVQGLIDKVVNEGVIDFADTPIEGIDVQEVVDRMQFADMFEAAHDAFAAAQSNLTGTIPVWEGLYNTVVDVIGGNATESIIKAAGAFGEGVKGAAKAVGSTVLGHSGEAGGLVNAGMRGMESGGPAGAAGAVLGQLLVKTKAFERIVGFLNDSIMPSLVAVLEPLAEALQPVVVLVGRMVQIIAAQLAPVFEALSPVLEFVATILQAVGMTILMIFKGLGNVWNGIVGAVQGVFQSLGNIEIDLPGLDPFHPLGFLGDWAEGMDRAKVNMNGVDRALEMLGDTSIPGVAEALGDTDKELGDAGDSAGDVADRMSELNASLTNVPQGFKYALRKFQSEDGGVLGGDGSASGPAQKDRGMVINIVANDALGIWRQLNDIDEFHSFVREGTTARRRPFAVSRNGA